MERAGLVTGSYNLPDWGDSPEAFRRILDSLFRTTPPTAVIVDQPVLCVALLQHLSRLGIAAPGDVSIACTDMSESFGWCVPAISHIAWDAPPIINRVVKWAENISRGKNDRRKGESKARLVHGGTIGPAPVGR